jgi:hypothetical protein
VIFAELFWNPGPFLSFKIKFLHLLLFLRQHPQNEKKKRTKRKRRTLPT